MTPLCILVGVEDVPFFPSGVDDVVIELAISTNNDDKESSVKVSRHIRKIHSSFPETQIDI
jgi:hypothetical protein